MSERLAAQAGTLAGLARRGRLRALSGRAGVDFASNDYLGLAASPAMTAAAQGALERGEPVGSGGSRLLRGNHPEHEALEAEAGGFFGSEGAGFWPTGFAAISALRATVRLRRDAIFADALIHASMHEGLKLSKAAHYLLPHNDVAAMDAAIAAWRASGGMGTPWIAVESLYSMDGDFAPLAALAQVAARHDALMLVDEAHATGVFGPGGRGLVGNLANRDQIITLHTCGQGAAGMAACCACHHADDQTTGGTHTQRMDTDGRRNQTCLGQREQAQAQCQP